MARAPGLGPLVALLVTVGACGDKPPAKAPEPLLPDGASSLVGAPASPPTVDATPALPAPAALAIISLEPAKGDADGGTYLRVLGTNFIKDGPRAAKVYFGSRQGVIVRFASDTELIVQAPGGKAGEVVDVLLVFEPGGTFTLPSAFTFIVKNDAPTVDDLQPATGGVTVVGAGGSTEGSLTSAAVMKRIQTAYIGSIKTCYKDYLKKNGTARGKLSLTFSVTKRGKTSGIKVTGFAAELDACLKTAMASWTFPVSTGKDGAPQDVSFNVALQLAPD